MFTVWYVGGQEKLRPLWRHYFNNTDGFELNRLAGINGTCNFVKARRRLLEETVRLSRAWGIHALTAFAFSKENWSHPKVEVDFFMRLFEWVIHDSVAEFLRWNEESLRESMKRHEHFLALQLGLKPGMKVLDVGCGIGGPLREIARFSSTSVTGLNNNEYQISRGKELNRLAGVSGTCNFVKVCWLIYCSTFPSWFSSFVCFAVLSSLLFGRARGPSSAAGHEAGRRLLEETVRLSRAWGIHVLTAFAFSKENWSRPKVETS